MLSTTTAASAFGAAPSRIALKRPPTVVVLGTVMAPPILGAKVELSIDPLRPTATEFLRGDIDWESLSSTNRAAMAIARAEGVVGAVRVRERNREAQADRNKSEHKNRPSRARNSTSVWRTRRRDATVGDPASRRTLKILRVRIYVCPSSPPHRRRIYRSACEGAGARLDRPVRSE